MKTDKEPGDTYALWTQIIDDTPHACWYRLLDDGQLEVWARGHHVVVPIEALALLPESIARAVLSKLAQGDAQATIELNLLSESPSRP